MSGRLILILFIILCIIIILISLRYSYFYIHRLKNKISFKESMDLTDLPVITFYSNNTKLNFLLDTGSDCSYINELNLKNIEYTLQNKVSNVVGMEGNPKTCQLCSVNIQYKDQQFLENFIICDLSKAFDVIKKENGVQIHGILGSKFFKKYKYIIDFNELIAYNK